MSAETTYYACDADGFPVWLHPLTEEEARLYSPHHLMPTTAYTLAFAARFGEPARWRVFPR